MLFKLYFVSKKAHNDHWRRQLGTFILDVDKTDLGVYKRNEAIYKNLTITFYPNYTFKFNMKVPFIYDSIGTWSVSGSNIDEWNQIYYGGDKSMHNPFDQCCRSDSTFYVSSVTPQKGQPFLQEIVFKKL